MRRRGPRRPRSFNEAAGIHRRKREQTDADIKLVLAASMRPPEFTGGNVAVISISRSTFSTASMRPPEFTGGNRSGGAEVPAVREASMRPPEFTGGNVVMAGTLPPVAKRFNEAAGIHRRKPPQTGDGQERSAIVLQ